MNARKFTKIFIVVVFAVIIVTDIVLLKLNATVSRQMMIWGAFPLLPFFFGVIPLHFWGGTRRDYFGRARLPLLIGAGVVMLGLSIAVMVCGWTWIQGHPLIWFAAGMPVGHVLWSQKLSKGESDGNA